MHQGSDPWPFVPKICGGCGTKMSILMNGDIWINEVGMIPLCNSCIDIILVALPILRLTLKLKMDKQKEKWNGPVVDKKKQKFILLTRPKEK